MSNNIYTEGVEILRQYKKNQKTVNTWFYVQEEKMEIMKAMRSAGMEVETPAGQAELLCRLADKGVMHRVNLHRGHISCSTRAKLITNRPRT